MKLDGISLLVRSKVDARLTPVQMETAPTQETGEVQDYVSAHLRGTVVPSKLDNKVTPCTCTPPDILFRDTPVSTLRTASLVVLLF